MRSRRQGPIVTIDGPAGSGKSTTARAVARRLGFTHLDSGALYRALTYALLRDGPAPEAWAGLTAEDFAGLGIRVLPGHDELHVYLGKARLGQQLRTRAVTQEVSQLSSYPEVRSALLDLQRDAGRHGRLVADGRDMGTVVFPDADVKVFLVADLTERARRRLLERISGPPSQERLRREAREIAARDERDSRREHSPLQRAPGALVLDTTGMEFGAQVEAVVDHVRNLTGP